MARRGRREVLRLCGAVTATGIAGCSSTPSGEAGTPAGGGTPSGEAGSPADGGTPSTETTAGTTPAGTETTTPPTDEDTPTAASEAVESPGQAVEAMLDAMGTGDLDRIRSLSVGFEDLDGEWSPDATLYLKGDGDTLATELIQGEATARTAYGNVEPDGDYVEVPRLRSVDTTENPELRDRLNEMTGPRVDRVVVASPAFDVRVNFEGEWYEQTLEGSERPKAVAIAIDEGWYLGTAITPWWLATTLIPEDAQLPAARVAKMRSTLELPLGPQESPTS